MTKVGYYDECGDWEILKFDTREQALGFIEDMKKEDLEVIVVE